MRGCSCQAMISSWRMGFLGSFPVAWFFRKFLSVRKLKSLLESICRKLLMLSSNSNPLRGSVGLESIRPCASVCFPFSSCWLCCLFGYELISNRTYDFFITRIYYINHVFIFFLYGTVRLKFFR